MSMRDIFVRATALMAVLAATPGCSGGGGGEGGGGGGGGSGGGGGGSGAVGSVRTLTFPAGLKGSSPRFSHDGALLAHVRDDGTNYSVAVMSTTGSDVRTLATDADYLTAMAWTSDDSELVYYSTQGIRAVPLAGGYSRAPTRGSRSSRWAAPSKGSSCSSNLPFCKSICRPMTRASPTA